MSFSVEWGGGWLGALAALALLAAAVWHCRRTPARGVLLALRLLGAAALALAVLQPTVALSEPQLVKPRLLVLIDHGHPMGAISGAKAMRQAVDAVMAGIPLGEAAGDHPELKAAIDSWGVYGREDKRLFQMK